MCVCVLLPKYLLQVVSAFVLGDKWLDLSRYFTKETPTANHGRNAVLISGPILIKQLDLSTVSSYWSEMVLQQGDAH